MSRCEAIASALDITGEWHGTFAYPRDYGPATPFLAKIEEQGGVFSGSIVEPDIFHDTGATLEARMSGHRDGRSIDFTKSYLGQRYGYENPVDYVGQLSVDGLSIVGVWSLLEHNGTFEMHRDRAAQATESIEIGETVPIR